MAERQGKLAKSLKFFEDPHGKSKRRESGVSKSSKFIRFCKGKLISGLFYLKREFPPSTFTVKPNGFATFGLRRAISTANGNVFCLFERPGRPDPARAGQKSGSERLARKTEGASK